MNTIFTAIQEQLNQKYPMVLVTIISQSGSSPRGLGAQMLVKADESIVGSVGGGALENTCRMFAKDCLTSRQSIIQKCVLQEHGAHSIGAVCGGTVQALMQYIDAASSDWLSLTEQVLDLLQAHQTGWLVLPFDGSVPSLLHGDGSLVSGSVPDETALPRQGRCLKTETRFYLPLPVTERAIVFGGGHCAQALVPVLTAIGFRVTVFDNRPEYTTGSLFPDAEALIYGEYGHIAEHLTLLPSDFVVVMSHGHLHDLEILTQVLQNPPCYVGAMGSRRKNAFINEQLHKAGISKEVIGQIHSPIGTAIKAVTPAEIAISIAGEMIYERALMREALTH